MAARRAAIEEALTYCACRRPRLNSKLVPCKANQGGCNGFVHVECVYKSLEERARVLASDGVAACPMCAAVANKTSFPNPVIPLPLPAYDETIIDKVLGRRHPSKHANRSYLAAAESTGAPAASSSGSGGPSSPALNGAVATSIPGSPSATTTPGVPMSPSKISLPTGACRATPFCCSSRSRDHSPILHVRVLPRSGFRAVRGGVHC